MIKTLFIENLKSFGSRQTVPLAPITLVYGANSSGKSSLIQALLLLAQTNQLTPTDEAALVVRGSMADLGSYQSLIFDHDLSRVLTLGIEGQLAKDPRPRQPVIDRLCAEYTFSWDRRNRTVRQDSLLLTIREQALRFLRHRRTIEAKDSLRARRARDFFTLADVSSRRHWHELAIEIANQEVTRRTATSSARPSPSMLPFNTSPEFPAVGPLPGTLPDEILIEGDNYIVRTSLQAIGWERLFRDAQSVLRSALDDVVYLGPLRRPPERFRTFLGSPQRNVGREGENYVDILARTRPLVGEVNQWLTLLGVPYQVAVRLAGDVAMGDLIALQLTDTRSGIKVSPSDVGFGISQLLPIVVQCLLGRRSVICIEQPEIHVHPKLQTEMGNLFAQAKNLGNQLIVETHSEHILLRLQRLIRTRGSQVSNSDVNVLFVEADERGAATVHNIRLDEQGELMDQWPGGFFEERFAELFARRQ